MKYLLIVLLLAGCASDPQCDYYSNLLEQWKRNSNLIKEIGDSYTIENKSSKYYDSLKQQLKLVENEQSMLLPKVRYALKYCN